MTTGLSDPDNYDITHYVITHYVGDDCDPPHPPLTTNDAAERLRGFLDRGGFLQRVIDLDAALAAERKRGGDAEREWCKAEHEAVARIERRATVEAVADLFEGPNGPPQTTNHDGQQVVDWDAVERAILDAEAER